MLEDERRKAIEWLEQYHGSLRIAEPARKYLTNAIVCSNNRNLREAFGSWIPVEIGKAIETQFRAHVWAFVWPQIQEELPQLAKRGDYERPTINKIYHILSGATNELGILIKGVQEKLQRHMKSNELFDPDHVRRLKTIMEDSSKARHGQLGAGDYGKSELERFLGQTELKSERGWIFSFLVMLERSH